MTPEGEAKLKQVALEKAENHAVMAIDDVYAMAEVYVKDTANPYDDTALEFLKSLKGQLVAQADKIDGQANR